jgi:hypothetical protein
MADDEHVDLDLDALGDTGTPIDELIAGLQSNDPVTRRKAHDEVRVVLPAARAAIAVATSAARAEALQRIQALAEYARAEYARRRATSAHSVGCSRPSGARRAPRPRAIRQRRVRRVARAPALTGPRKPDADDLDHARRRRAR